MFHTSSKRTSGPRRRESVLAHNFRVARYSGTTARDGAQTTPQVCRLTGCVGLFGVVTGVSRTNLCTHRVKLPRLDSRATRHAEPVEPACLAQAHLLGRFSFFSSQTIA